MKKMNKWQFKTIKITDQAGFSLLEVAVGMIILGLLITPFLHLLKLEQKRKIVERTEGNLSMVDSALSKYAVRTGRYPIPAARNLGATDVNFGQETLFASIAACTGGDETVACRAAGFRDTTADVDAVNDTVLIGDVPFAEIGLPYKFILDGYGRKVTYTVSEHMTDAALAPVEDDWGSIEVIDAAGADHRGTARNVHFALVSHGSNGEGTYALSGGQFRTCAGSGVEVENANCDSDGSFLSNFNDVVDSADSLGNPITRYDRVQSVVLGGAYYDDYMRVRTTVTGDIWTQQIGVNDIFNTNTGNIRIGSYPVGALASPDARVTIMDGNISSQDDPTTINADPATILGNESRVYTNRLCNLRGGDPDYGCLSTTTNTSLILPAPPRDVFSPAVFGGSVLPGNEGLDGGGIKCAEVSPGIYEPMNRIRRADEECGLNRLPATFNYNSPCPSGQYPRGVSAGVIVCEVP
jgi:prepilin-type N-terminal cleavage/methylation domain-containing protein